MIAAGGRALAQSVMAALLLLTASCASTPADRAPDRTAPDSVELGDLLSTPKDFVGYPALESLVQKAVRIEYRSTSGITGAPTEVTGVVFVPTGEPPPGGWPVASIGHATTGTTSRCAPSTDIGLRGNLTTVIPFLANGYVVTMSDYEGLGSPGPHPYLKPSTAGYNIIDAVRAARIVEPRTSTEWAGYGVSQGGQAVWAANELAGEYGGGLQLVGTFSASPATDLTPLADSMVDGTLTEEQITVLPSILRGLRVAHPELNLDDYLHGVLWDRLDVFSTCIGDNTPLQASVAQTVTRADYAPASEDAAQRLREWLTDYSVPSRPATAPLLVAYGDQDQLVNPAWTIDAVRRACEKGDAVELEVAPGQGHGILNLGALPEDWFEARFRGDPAPSTCT